MQVTKKIIVKKIVNYQNDNTFGEIMQVLLVLYLTKMNTSCFKYTTELYPVVFNLLQLDSLCYEYASKSNVQSQKSLYKQLMYVNGRILNSISESHPLLSQEIPNSLRNQSLLGSTRKNHFADTTGRLLEQLKSENITSQHYSYMSHMMYEMIQAV